MEARDRYQQWLNFEDLSEEETQELKALSEEEIEDRFYKELSFGTAGLRGQQGLGSNRMNRFVVARATAGLAQVILDQGEEAKKKGVAIAWDVRINSDLYKDIAARVLAHYGIKVYLFEDIRPTPMLSFAVRQLRAQAGIVITASHNPQEYNGYKVYWEEGSQIRDDIADKILKAINSLSYQDPQLMDLEEAKKRGLIEIIPKSLEEDYYQKTLDMAIYDEEIKKDICVVYSPLNGTGNKPVRHVLKERGFSQIHVVAEQEEPDGTFATVGYPNPEDIKAFDYALRDGRALDADLIFATDPDSDRVAMLAKNKEGDYQAFTGNQTGALLIYYILSGLKDKGTLPKDGALVKSIVTGDLGTKICQTFQVPMYNSLTGFKNICALANQWDKTGDHQFIFGFEESIGYVYGDHVRDKDAVVSSMMIVEMAAYYLAQGKTLSDVLEEIYQTYGYHDERLKSIVLEGREGAQRIERIMEDFRQDPIKDLGSLKLDHIEDYLHGLGEIGPSNLLAHYLEDGSRFYLRPSGTEPKIKLYIYTEDPEEQVAREKLDIIEKALMEKMSQVQ
ncbi:MAG: phospho-sugar mutase [Tissierellia bacterium]|nr:phospho-sugar mutase [Tissierellia bacterium]